jgi:hypothetical protein
MPRKDKPAPALSAAGAKDAAAKQQRLGAALRENLLKRKSQRRARSDAGAGRPKTADAGDVEK